MLPNEIEVNFKFRPWFLLISPLGVLIAVGLFYLPWGAESAPSWVQAVGSVAAIVAAVMIANHQHDVAMQKSKTEERQRAAGHAGRLAFLALEIDQVLSEVVLSTHQPGVEHVDAKAANVLEVMLTRLNRNFDDDLDLDRVGYCFEIRVLLSAAIFTLKSSAGIPGHQRDAQIGRYKATAKEILDKCANHAREVRLKV